MERMIRMYEEDGDFLSRAVEVGVTVDQLRPRLASGEFADYLIGQISSRVPPEEVSAFVSAVLALDGWDANEKNYLEQLKGRLDALVAGDEIDQIFRGTQLKK